LGHLNVSDTNFPIGLCQAGGVLGCPGLLGRGSLGYLPGRGFRLLIGARRGSPAIYNGAR
jgi:hypothetical protein